MSAPARSTELTAVPAEAAAAVPLDTLKRGTRAVVDRVEGDDAVARRLVDLGFRTGTEVEVQRLAPLGDPIQYRLHGYRLALRKAEARRVLTRPASR